MSLAIDPKTVVGIRLSGSAVWYQVAVGSFTLDSYEVVDGDFVLHGGGQHGVCALGFKCHARMSWDQNGTKMRENSRGKYEVMCGPFSSVVALVIDSPDNKLPKHLTV